MPEIKGELIIFLVSFVTGTMLRLTYQSIRVLRQIIEHSLSAIGIEDLIFWLGAALYVFVQIYHTSDGSIRWYFVLGLVFGTVFCEALLRRFQKG